MPRALSGRCCREETHLTNFAEVDYTKKLANTLQSLGKQLRSLVWHRHWKNVSVVNPAAHMGIGLGGNDDEREEDLRVGELMRLWGPDPVHPTETAYDQLADALLGKVAMAGRERKGSNSSTLEAPPGTKKRKRSPSVDRRPSWIRESVTEVGRRPHSFSGRGSHQDWSPEVSGPGNSNSSHRVLGGCRGARGIGGHRGGRCRPQL